MRPQPSGEKPSWFQSEIRSHWSTTSSRSFWDMCLVSSLPRHWAGIVSFRVSRRALELERERQHSRPGSRPRKVARRQGNKRRPTSAAVVTCVVQRYLATYNVQQSLITYNDVVTDNVQRSALDLICQCKIYSTVKDRPMHVEESSS